MKTRRILVAILLVVLVCAVFVACNENTPQIETPNENNQGQQEPSTEETEFPIAEKKPTADPDPNNPYDTHGTYTDYSKGNWNFDGTAVIIDFTNSESLNNLFYNYSMSDFDKEKFKSVDESQQTTLDIIRKRVISYGYADKEVKKYNRGLRLELANPSKENALKYIDEFNQIKGVRYAYPELYGSWFLTSNDPYVSQQQDSFDKIKLNDAWDITTGTSSVMWFTKLNAGIEQKFA